MLGCNKMMYWNDQNVLSPSFTSVIKSTLLRIIQTLPLLVFCQSNNRQYCSWSNMLWYLILLASPIVFLKSFWEGVSWYIQYKVLYTTWTSTKKYFKAIPPSPALKDINQIPLVVVQHKWLIWASYVAALKGSFTLIYVLLKMTQHCNNSCCTGHETAPQSGLVLHKDISQKFSPS